MGKIKEFFKGRQNMSLKWCFFLYLPICAVIAFAVAFFIGVSTNYAQSWYRAKYSVPEEGGHLEIYFDDDGTPHTGYVKDTVFIGRHDTVYDVISSTQVVLIPAWVILCVGFTGKIFYSRELKEPITVLMNASKNIS